MALLPLLGAGVQIIGGLLGQGESKRHRKESERLAKEADTKRVPLEDIEQRQYLNELQRKRRAAETGYAYQDAASKLGQEQALATENILRASGGAGGAAIAGITNAQRATGMGMSKIAQIGDQQAMQYQQMYGSLLDTMAQRKADLQLNEYQRLLAQSEQERQAADETGMGATASIIGGITSGLANIGGLGGLLGGGKSGGGGAGAESIDSGITDYSIGGLRRQLYGDNSISGIRRGF